jgi:hypothetical protein
MNDRDELLTLVHESSDYHRAQATKWFKISAVCFAVSAVCFTSAIIVIKNQK